MLHAFFVSNLCFACFASQTPGLCSTIPSAPVQFAARLSLILLHSVIFVLRALPHKHWVCAVLFPRLPYSLLHGCVYFALFSNFLLCLFCLTNIVFVQCSPFGSRSLLHAFVVSNIFFVLFASPTSGLCSAFPFGSPQVYTLLCFFVLFSSLLFLYVLCLTSSGFCSDFFPAPLEFARFIFCVVLFSFNFVFCVVSLTKFIFLQFP